MQPSNSSDFDSQSLSRRGVLGLSVAALTGGCSAVAGDDDSFPDGDWPMVGRDAANTAYVPDATVPSAVEEQWSVRLSNWPFTSPVVADGVVYVGTADELRAYRAADGEAVWTATLPTEVHGTPAVDVARGLVYATSGRGGGRESGDDATLHAFDVGTGDERWSVTLRAEKAYAVRLADGEVYVRTDDGCVALADGEIRWRRDGLGPVGNEEFNSDDIEAGDVAPAVAGDAVYVTANSALLALDRESGEKRWSVPVEYAFGGPAVRDGVVYVQGYRSAKAVDADGTVRWTRDRGAIWQPAVAPDGVFFEDDDVAEVDPETGETRWTYDLRTDIIAATPAVLGEFVVAIGLRSGALRREKPLLGLGRRVRWRLPEQAANIVSPAVGSGVLFVVARFPGERLVAYG